MTSARLEVTKFFYIPAADTASAAPVVLERYNL